jgi:hypothetical protein
MRLFEALIGEWHGDGEVIGGISAEGKTIAGRWERGTGEVGDKWEIDFPINYMRK